MVNRTTAIIFYTLAAILGIFGVLYLLAGMFGRGEYSVLGWYIGGAFFLLALFIAGVTRGMQKSAGDAQASTDNRSRGALLLFLWIYTALAGVFLWQATSVEISQYSSFMPYTFHIWWANHNAGFMFFLLGVALLIYLHLAKPTGQAEPAIKKK